MSLFKKIIAPIQNRILEKHMCVACTQNLDKQKKREPLTTETEIVLCSCGRAYVYNRPHRQYRRALVEEVRRAFPARPGFPAY